MAYPSSWLPGDKRKCEKPGCIEEADHGDTLDGVYMRLCKSHWADETISEKKYNKNEVEK